MFCRWFGVGVLLNVCFVVSCVEVLVFVFCCREILDFADFLVLGYRRGGLVYGYFCLDFAFEFPLFLLCGVLGCCLCSFLSVL